ncbi:hypothetical protein [Bradyrhizobium sp. 2TAF24]|uniref:hypothetical protein n=1 Tax=Bradyrhizobium sp. 2TAF24 TaxID=3233011 RepID=UPI003F8FAECF
MPTPSNRALMFDDLLDADSNASFPPAGVRVDRAPDGSLSLDPRYETQLASAFARRPPQATLRERLDRDAVFSAGTAPFGFAGPGMPSFDERSDAAIRDLNRFRATPLPEGPRKIEDWLPNNSASQFGGVVMGRAGDGSIRLDPRYEAELAARAAPAPAPTREQINRAVWEKMLSDGHRNNYDEIANATAFRGHRDWAPPTADDVMWSRGTHGLTDQVLAFRDAMSDALQHGENPSSAYRDELAVRRDWVKRGENAPVAAENRTDRSGALSSNFTGPLMDGLTMGTWNQILAAARAVNEYSHGGSYQDSYPRFLAEEREGMSRYKKEYPERALAGQAIGTVAGLALPVTKVFGIPKAATLAGAVGLGMLNGAIKHGVAGAIRTDGDWSDRLEEGTKDAALGMVTGGLGGGGLYKFRHWMWPDVFDMMRRQQRLYGY